MTQLPAGTVTFLFTDIEGSTRLAQAHPDALKDTLARHRAILQHAIELHHGYVFQIIGDAFCAAFATAPDALKAALAAQRALYTEAWRETGPIRVRMGLHAGLAQVRQDDIKAGQYSGYITLARTQRIMSAGHGGQVLLTQAVYELVRDHLPEDVTLRDLGEHRLKDLSRPDHLFQLATSDLPFEFPPLKTLDRVPNNLPIQLTSFIGREHEVGEVKRLLSAARLLTLTGSGGAGKTRLSLQVAADVLDNYKHGAWYIELASLTDPALIPQTVASVVGLREEQGRPVTTVLSDYLHAKTALIILDNCEHLIAGCAQFADTILHAAPNVKILASSREALGIGGEAAYRVPSLAVPDPQHTPSIEMLTQYDAVKLFIERALAVQPAFQVNNANAPAVAQICYHLDGIPLAIELAAARVRGMKVEQIAQRLNDRFRLLTDGSRTELPRHQTLRAMIDWSHSLLSDQERILFRRLSIFAGGWSIESAEAVCVGDGLESSAILDVLLHLVDKSLIIIDEQSDETRYQMLETIREYARDKSIESGEEGKIHQQHLAFFIHFAEQAEPELRGRAQMLWFKRLEIEHDNLRRALGWSLEQKDARAALQLAGALFYFWEIRGYLIEGQNWLERALAMVDRDSTLKRTTWRAKALLGLGAMVSWLWTAEKKSAMVEESLDIYRELNDAWGMGYALFLLAWIARNNKNLAAARTFIVESIRIRQAAHDQWGAGNSLHLLGHVLQDEGDNAAALSAYSESVTLLRPIGDRWSMYSPLSDVAVLKWQQGYLSEARAWLEECLGAYQNLGNRSREAYMLLTLGEVARDQGDFATARESTEKSLAIYRELDIKRFIGWSLCYLGMIALSEGDLSRARAYFEPSQEIFRQLDDQENIGWMLAQFGFLSLYEGDYGQARQQFEASVPILQVAYKSEVPMALLGLAQAVRLEGDWARASEVCKQSLGMLRELDIVLGVPDRFECLAQVAVMQGRVERAAQLFGAAGSLRAKIGMPLPPVERAEYERNLVAARAQLDEAAFNAAWEAGQKMALERAIEYALEETAT